MNNVVLYSRLYIQNLLVDQWEEALPRLAVISWTRVNRSAYPLAWNPRGADVWVGRQRPFHIRARQPGQARRLLKAEPLLNYFWECIIHDPERPRGKRRRGESEWGKDGCVESLQPPPPSSRRLLSQTACVQFLHSFSLFSSVTRISFTSRS